MRLNTVESWLSEKLRTAARADPKTPAATVCDPDIESVRT